ncbi:MAG: hypothetical protein ACRDBG_27360, partial [Waterburya sp.]
MAKLPFGSFSPPSHPGQDYMTPIKIDSESNFVRIADQPVRVDIGGDVIPVRLECWETIEATSVLLLEAIERLAKGDSEQKKISLVEKTISVPFAVNTSNPTTTFSIPQNCISIKIRNVSPLMTKVTLAGFDGAITIPFNGSEDIDRISLGGR